MPIGTFIIIFYKKAFWKTIKHNKQYITVKRKKNASISKEHRILHILHTHNVKCSTQLASPTGTVNKDSSNSKYMAAISQPRAQEE
jgi:hypothetical protein